MDQNRPGTTSADPLDHSLYRVAHLHGTEWVTLKPSAQHSPREHDQSGAWAQASLYVCPSCEERVLVAPAG